MSLVWTYIKNLPIMYWIKLFLELMEAKTTRHTDRFDTTCHTLSPDILAEPTVDLQDLEAWREAPDMVEGDVSELAAPLRGDADAAEQRGQLVAAAFPQVEAGVGELPYTVDTVGTIGLS